MLKPGTVTASPFHEGWNRDKSAWTSILGLVTDVKFARNLTACQLAELE